MKSETELAQLPRMLAEELSPLLWHAPGCNWLAENAGTTVVDTAFGCSCGVVKEPESVIRRAMLAFAEQAEQLAEAHETRSPSGRNHRRCHTCGQTIAAAIRELAGGLKK